MAAWECTVLPRVVPGKVRKPQIGTDTIEPGPREEMEDAFLIQVIPVETSFVEK